MKAISRILGHLLSCALVLLVLGVATARPIVALLKPRPETDGGPAEPAIAPVKDQAKPQGCQQQNHDKFCFPYLWHFYHPLSSLAKTNGPLESRLSLRKTFGKIQERGFVSLR